MSRQKRRLSKWGQFLYQTGCASQYIKEHGSNADKRRLWEACLNAESLVKLREKDSRLFDMVSDAPMSDWEEYLRVKSELSAVMQRFVTDAQLYEWPVLATSWLPDGASLPEQLIRARNIPTVQELMQEEVTEHGGGENRIREPGPS